MTGRECSACIWDAPRASPVQRSLRVRRPWPQCAKTGHSPKAWRTGQLDLCGPCQWSGTTPQLKGLGLDIRHVQWREYLPLGEGAQPGRTTADDLTDQPVDDEGVCRGIFEFGAWRTCSLGAFRL